MDGCARKKICSLPFSYHKLCRIFALAKPNATHVKPFN